MNDFWVSSAGIIIFVIAIVLGIISSLITKYTMGKDVKEIREKQKLINAELKEAIKRNDIKRAKELQKELINSSLSSMKFSLKPMLITLVPFLLVFAWMAGEYGNLESVNFEMWIDNPNFADFNCPPHPEKNIYCNSSYFNGTLHPGEKIDFSVITTPNPSLDKTIVNIKGHAYTKNADGNVMSYELSAETITVLNGTKEKNPYYKNEKVEVEITPKFLSEESPSGKAVTYNFQLSNNLSGSVVTIFGINLSWLVWYLIIAIPFSFIAGRLLRIY